MNYDLRKDLPLKRCTIAMWDFSWLHCHHRGGSFEDFSQVLGELVERGFNTVRIDAFPLLIGRLKSLDEEVTVLADPVANWGPCPADCRHRVARELVEFVSECKKRQVRVILSAWNLIRTAEYPDLKEPYAGDRDRFKSAWRTVLQLMVDHDLADHILYVDLDQEFPFFSPYLDGLNALGDGNPARDDEDAMEAAVKRRAAWGKRLAWNPDQLGYVADLFNEMIGHFQNSYPQFRYTYSLTGYTEEVRALNLKIFDVLELHFWIHAPRFENRTQFNEQIKDRGQRDYQEYARRLEQTMNTVRPMLIAEMHQKLQFGKSWAEEIAAPLVTTEAWGPWWHMDHEDLSWQWLYDWCGECMTIAEEYRLWGLTPWNYAHPYWRNWSNVSWYRQVNHRFLESC